MPRAATDRRDKLSLGFADAKSHRRTYPLRDISGGFAAPPPWVRTSLCEPHGDRGSMTRMLLVDNRGSWDPTVSDVPGQPTAVTARWMAETARAPARPAPGVPWLPCTAGRPGHSAPG